MSPEKRKPLIVVTGPNKGGSMAWFFTSLNIKLAGGKAYRAQAQNFSQPIHFDGLIIGGGTDIHPKNYKASASRNHKRKYSLILKEFLLYPLEFFNRLSKKETYDPERDKMELAYLQKAESEKKPILGICRGHQLINAKKGAQLIPSTLDYYQKTPRIRTLLPRKRISLEDKNSILYQIFNQENIKVNALHNQAIENTGRSIKVTSREQNSLIQSTEDKSSSILTVQWHPEYLIYLKKQRQIFHWLIQEAQK